MSQKSAPRAHKRGWSVIHDSTVATPFLNKPLQRDDKSERPDYLIHSYTKDLTGNGNATAGVVIGENKNMFHSERGDLPRRFLGEHLVLGCLLH